jgi:4-hydroxy-2-oxoheptanedioate aldolase
VRIDCEHGLIGATDILALVRAAEVVGLVPIVRVAQNQPVEILHALDTAAAGVMVPKVESALDAQRAVQFSRFYPEGERGLAATRAAHYGLKETLSDYIEQANRDLIVIALVESMRGLQNLDDIIKVSGVDAVFIGPRDLSLSMGFGGDAGEPEVRLLIEKALTTLKSSAKVAGISVSSGSEAKDLQKSFGVGLFATGIQTLFMTSGAEFLKQAR